MKKIKVSFEKIFDFSEFYISCTEEEREDITKEEFINDVEEELTNNIFDAMAEGQFKYNLIEE